MHQLRFPRCVTLIVLSVLFPTIHGNPANHATGQQPLAAEGDESQLVAILESDAELFDKAKACQRLAIIGTSRSIPAVAKLLADPQLSHYARTALESNPSPDVDQSLRTALKEVSGRQLVGVIHSVATRGDMQATPLLIELAADEQNDIATAAISALGRLANPEAIKVIQQALNDPEMRMTAADACLASADRLLIEGKNEQAWKLLESLRSSDLPRYINVAARFGAIRTGSQDVDELMMSSLADDDPELFRIGLELAHTMKDVQTTAKLLDRLDSLPVERQVLLIHVLGERGDRSALANLIKAAESDDADVRLAAIRVLGKLGNRGVLPILLSAAVSDDEMLAGTAQEALNELGGREIHEALAERLKNSQGRERLVLVKVAGNRGISEVIPLLLEYVTSEDVELSKSAIDGLGMTIGLEDFPQLVDQMLAMGSSPSAIPIKEALQKACQRMGDRDSASMILLERSRNGSAAAKLELMDLLIYIGGERALAGTQEAAQSDDTAAADAATRALGKWLTPDAAPTLLQLAKSGNPAYRVRCLRGYIRIIRQFGLKPGKRLEMSKQAFAAATRDQERALVLDTLTRFPNAQGLKMATQYAASPTLGEEACGAAVAISDKIISSDPQAVKNSMNTVIQATKSDQTAAQAELLLKRATAVRTKR